MVKTEGKTKNMCKIVREILYILAAIHTEVHANISIDRLAETAPQRPT